MKRGGWMVISLILVFIPLLIPLAGGHGLEPQEKWVAGYNALGNGDDLARDIAVDGSGNVYVIGDSKGLGTGSDYATIKYNTNGKQLWVARYNGPAKRDDWPSAIAVDGSGNVYVTGWSRVSDDNSDYATIKYNTNGKQLWVRRYNGPGNNWAGANAIAVDGSGNVYVTGYSECFGPFLDDYVTIKYDTNGKQLWVQRYDGPAKGDDEARAIAVDRSGNVFITGSSGGDYATIKYNTNGKQLWVKTYNGPAKGDDYASAIAVDGSGNVFVTGWSDGSGTFRDYATIKYNTNGKQLWAKRYDWPGQYEDFAHAIAIDGSGNVYVTGCSDCSGVLGDYATIKYNTNGKPLWVKRYGGLGNGYNQADDVAVDGSGNVFVTGWSDYDYATIKYNTNGKSLWIKRYEGPAKSFDGASAIAVDGSGNVYVTGDSMGSSTGRDYVTIKYNTTGKQLWVKRYNGPGNEQDYTSAIAVDGSGNVYQRREQRVGHQW